jgi:sugar phosphate isomerase/epimerase
MTKYQISTSTSFNYEIAIENQVSLISKAGFSHLTLGVNSDHFNYFDANDRIKLLRLLDKNNLKVDTIHGKGLHQDENLELLEKTIRAAKDLDVNYIVVHISPFMFDKKDYDKLFEKLKLLRDDLIKLVEKSKIKLALENAFPYHEIPA